MEVRIYGITGHREWIGKLELLDLEELSVGAEFLMGREVYEICSYAPFENHFIMNVRLVQAEAEKHPLQKSKQI